MSSPFSLQSRSRVFLAISDDNSLPCDCYKIIEQAAFDRCHGNNEAYVDGLNRLAKCSSENEQLSCRKKCREEVLKQADIIADYGVVLEGATVIKIKDPWYDASADRSGFHFIKES